MATNDDDDDEDDDDDDEDDDDDDDNDDDDDDDAMEYDLTGRGSTCDQRMYKKTGQAMERR